MRGLKTISLSQYSTTNLLDRRVLQTLREAIYNEIVSSAHGTVIRIDLTDIQWINSSGADEVIGAALRFIKESPKDIYLYIETSNNPYEHAYNLQKALQDSELPIMGRLKQEGAYEAMVIGSMNAYLSRVLEYVYSSNGKGVSSSGVSESLEMSKSMCSTSLSKLYDLRLIKRERANIGRGYEYRYFPLFIGST